VHYYNNLLMSAVSRAWLGPHYQLTAQVNSSHPGSAAQDPHCDYHLGFRSNEEVALFPTHAHRMSQFLTLQGAVAHVGMPLEAGPTTFLP
jgi:ectoine hydroxylase-related dioxygenase (phytanoyl-CoA dioxygenase family)